MSSRVPAPALEAAPGPLEEVTVLPGTGEVLQVVRHVGDEFGREGDRPDTGVGDARLVIDMLVGALQRLLIYPEQGFMISQQVPITVLDAYDRLSRAGYASRLLRGNEGKPLKPLT